MITIEYEPQKLAKYTAVEKLTMVINEESSRYEAQLAFKHFLAAIGYVFPSEVEEEDT